MAPHARWQSTEVTGAGVREDPGNRRGPGTSSESQEDMGSALPTTLMQESTPPLTAAAAEPPVVPEGGPDTVNAASAHVQYRLREYRFTRTCVVCQYTVCTDQCVY